MKNEDEFREFAATRTPSLVRAAHLLCGNHHEAEDLVQETLAKVYLAWRRTRIDNPAAYARTTLTRTFISRRRKLSSSEIPVALDADRTDEPTAPPVDNALRLDLLDQLRLLAPLDRAILVLRHLEDLSVRDTAHTLGISEQVVRTRSMRALAVVRERMTTSHSP